MGLFIWEFNYEHIKMILLNWFVRYLPDSAAELKPNIMMIWTVNG
jgi:hypothetical protein